MKKLILCIIILSAIVASFTNINATNVIQESYKAPRFKSVSQKPIVKKQKPLLNVKTSKNKNINEVQVIDFSSWALFIMLFSYGIYRFLKSDVTIKFQSPIEVKMINLSNHKMLNHIPID